MDKSLKKWTKRIAKHFLDLAIMGVLKNNEDMNGNELIECINDRIGIFISSGRIYSTLYALERKELITANVHSKSRTYRLTPSGIALLQEVNKAREAFNMFITQLCGKLHGKVNTPT
jgi:DNA-binding PadR family transcriptional regulator